uniref:Zinc finger FYVE-type containing 19 n=1 Tax=Catharus ustulatus TaxID=91951 RepID=A0A8C3UFI6_CATUS
MDSRCYGCASKFSVFKKECGCKNCGRSFCSGCRSFSAVVPRCGNTQQKVCKQCYGKLTGGCFLFSGLKSLFSIVMYFFHPYHRRVAAFEAKQNQYQGLSKEDRAIAERLERLREERKPKSIPTQAEIEARLAALKEDGRGPVPSTQEMEDRLAVLQGRDPPSQAPRPVHQPPDTRSLVQQTDDLLTQLSEEVAIDEHYRPREPSAVSSQSLNDLNRESEDNVCPANLDPKQLEEEKNKLLAEAAAELREENTRQEKILQVAKRLAALKGEDPEKGGFLALCCYQLTEEAALDEASGFNIPPDQTTQPGPSQQNLMCRIEPLDTLAKADDSDEDELPWCCICNEDATLRCHGCDGDLYCQCFRENHMKMFRKHMTGSVRLLKTKHTNESI